MRYIKGGQDEYYTSDAVASNLVHITLNELSTEEFLFFVEPSAGAGAFSLRLPDPKVAFDINPQVDSIVELDFLADDFDEFIPEDMTIVSIGNPPFGFACNKAIQFFNRCAEFSNYIAFIVPRTFKKISVQNRLHKNFHLAKEFTVPKYAFVVDGKPYDVPCVFQIWERKENLRPIKTGNLAKYLVITTPDKADFAMRRVGGKAGQVLTGLDHSISSTYFFKEVIKGTKDLLKNATFEDRDNTAGVRSISQLEIFEYLEEQLKK
jgi:hypothetical protein